MAGYETVLEALTARDLVKSTWGGRINASCPAHDDDRPSLSLSEGEDGRALLYCHAGCSTTAVVEALGLTLGDLFIAGPSGSFIADRYVYTDEEGAPLIRVSRTEPKGFYQERWESDEWKPGLRETRRVLFNLPMVLAAASRGEMVYVVEGEKDVINMDRLASVVATTALGGAGKWRPEYTEALKGADVVVVADADDVGLKHAMQVATETNGRVVTPRGKDASEHLLAGFDPNDFEEYNLDDTFEEWDPWDYQAPEDEWLLEPYVPRASRVLLHGASGSLKTLWAMWLAWHLADEGCKVAFISTEMNKGQAAKRFQRFPKRPGLRVYGRFMLGQNLGTAIKNWEGYDLIIIDSWSSTQGGMESNSNDAVSTLDVEFFQPLVQATGATVLVIDNTGHDAITKEGKVKRDSARGASRKRDIQEVELFFSRPDRQNNFRTSIEVTKMRLDRAIPGKEVVETPRDRIEFYLVTSGLMTTTPLWPRMKVDAEEQEAIDMIQRMLGGGINDGIKGTAGGTDPGDEAEAAG